ncbi:AFG1-family ATPase [Magnetococcus marinus MC-1]|uniref:AFG1-family ATPase n=1 Tax=Magnetococcus marinus (strain ATCC BAA-1437 / JCM 17883 / MC-1) TaxID=156889 RepID=A0L6M1_MAGMM|nr:cell division protein ZapE [Magnetococcus marinus]ABK43614.1 AFG1-family ATPase [Magnetococcus marinus MC-1]
MSRMPTITPTDLFSARVQAGTLRDDVDQVAVLPQLDLLAERMNQPVERVEKRGLQIWRPLEGKKSPRGLYLHGPVGRGKSMLMQLLFDAAAVSAKRRVHFHPFMEELHQRMHRCNPPRGIDMLDYIASELSQETRLLCFDEFFVTNIGDAMLLGRLLESLFKCGVTLCATSNWAPENLFQGGYNRLSFIPFLKILQQNVTILDLAHGVDWRRNPLTDGSEGELQTFDQIFESCTAEQPTPRVIRLKKEEMTAVAAANGCYWFDFAELCQRSLGRTEYLDLCSKAQVVLLSDIPVLTEELSDPALRMVVLIDLLYEHGIPMRIDAAAPVDELCTGGPVSFTYQRTASRLYELMRKPLPEVAA